MTDNDMNLRILIVDDNESTHADFQKILAPETGDAAIEEAEAHLFDDVPEPATAQQFELDSAYQGEEALAKVQEAVRRGRPYAMAFVDVRMPPGWDGIETIARLWPVDPDLQVVVFTAYSDHSWEQMIEKLGLNDRLLILKKPFENAEVRQLAVSITEKRRLATRAKMKLYEVDRIVETRTRDLESTHVDLATARDEAQAANHAKSDFLANMSHEIRTPMTAILGFADLLNETLRDHCVPTECADAVRTIQRNGEYLLAIIDDILDISKIEAGKMVIERVACSPRQLVNEVAELVRVRSESKGLALDVECAESVPQSISTDPTRLQQILINLLGNAIKFTRSGSIRLVVETDRNDAQEPILRFDVVDSGIGMTADQAAGLFQPFQQADNSTTREFGGTGLGLHLSKRLAEMLGGDLIIAETAPGVGTRFRATVAATLLEGHSPASDRAWMETKKDQKAVDARKYADLSHCHVLLAEDALDNQRLISLVLKKAGADVKVADNGKLAVDAALTAVEEGRPFDVLLMDMKMPVMDGYEASAWLRRRGYTGPIVALTAHAMSSDREKCLRAGCDDYATKPIDRAKLIQTVSEFARRAAKGADVPTSGDERPDRVATAPNPLAGVK